MLDTHVLIWMINKDVSKIKKPDLKFFNEDCCVSVESLKEIALKVFHGKLDDVESNPRKLFKKIADYDISVLDFDKNAVTALFDLPYNENHKDPFDRSIIAHAISKKMVLVSADNQFQFYQKHGLLLQKLK